MAGMKERGLLAGSLLQVSFPRITVHDCRFPFVITGQGHLETLSPLRMRRGTCACMSTAIQARPLGELAIHVSPAYPQPAANMIVLPFLPTCVSTKSQICAEGHRLPKIHHLAV